MYSKNLTYANWCNCPCAMKTYEPNQLDIMMVDEYMLTLATEMHRTTRIECVLPTFHFLPREKVVSMINRLENVRLWSIKTMLYRMLNRCRHLYVDLPSKIRCIIRMHWIYLHGSEFEYQKCPDVSEEDRDKDTMRALLKHFNTSLLHHITTKDDYMKS